jgi:hypothetical protein
MMGHKTFTCSICGETVTKPQSYSLPDGSRACRTHQEAQDARQAIINDEAAKRQQAKEAFENRKNRFRREMPSDTNCNCAHCKAKGVMRNILAMIRLECSAIARSISEPEFDLNEDGYVNQIYRKIVTEMFGEVVGVTRYDVSSLEDWQINQLVKDPEMKMVVKMAKIVVLCQKCADEFKLPRTTPSIETLSMYAGIAEDYVKSRAETYK